MIGDDIQLSVVSLDDHKVFIGINAPKNIMVHRQEIFEHIRRKYIFDGNYQNRFIERASDVSTLAMMKAHNN